jgi:hypothetical protein
MEVSGRRTLDRFAPEMGSSQCFVGALHFAHLVRFGLTVFQAQKLKAPTRTAAIRFLDLSRAAAVVPKCPHRWM